MPSKSNIYSGVFFFYGIVYLFSAYHIYRYEFGKSANSSGSMVDGITGYLYNYSICLATIGVCVFRCARFS